MNIILHGQKFNKRNIGQAHPKRIMVSDTNIKLLAIAQKVVMVVLVCSVVHSFE